jgi:hypothetical protein
MIDANSPAGSWQREIDLMHVKQLKTAPVALCEAAPWHYDPSRISKLKNVGEDALQASIKFDIENTFDCIVSAVPNGTHIVSKVSRAKAKREGLRAGYPDLIIDGFGCNYGKVFRAEIKAGSRVSVSQFECLTILHENGHKCGVFRSADTLIEAMRQEGWR